MSLVRFALPPSAHVVADHLRALAAVLADLLASPVDVTVSQSLDHLGRNLLSRAVDAAFAPAQVCARVEVHGGTVAACAVRDDETMLGAALLKRKGAATSLSMPKQIRAAWSAPDEVVGHLLPLAHLRETRKLDPARHFASQTFCDTTADAIAAVLDGRADLCAVPARRARVDDVGATLERYAPGRAGALQVLELTGEVAAEGVVTFDAQLGGALGDAFAHLEREAAGQRLLTLLFCCDGFAPPPPRAYRALHGLVGRDA